MKQGHPCLLVLKEFTFEKIYLHVSDCVSYCMHCHVYQILALVSVPPLVSSIALLLQLILKVVVLIILILLPLLLLLSLLDYY